MNRHPRYHQGLLILMITALVWVHDATIHEARANTTGNLVPVNNGGLNSSNSWVNTSAATCVVDGVNCYTEVDDTPGSPNGDTDYVRRAGNGNNRDVTFNLDLSTIANNSTITDVAITFTCRGEGGTVTAESEIRVDAVQTLFGSSVTCPAAYGTFTQTFTGLSITKLAATDFEIGFRNTQNNVVRLTAIYAVITYTPPVSPTTTTLGNGAAEPSSVTIPPGNAAVMIDAFSFQTNTGTETVTAITVNLAGAPSGVPSGALSLIEITNTAGTTVYGSVANPVTGLVAIGLLTSITATTTLTEYRIRITPSTHANMPPPLGATYTVTATASSWSGAATHAGTDTGSATITIDNLSPAEVSGATLTFGSKEVSLFWENNPPDADFHSVVVLRRAAAAVADVPVEGVTYTVGNTIGTSTVACVVTGGGISCEDTDPALTNGTTYYYKVFTRDNYANYSVGVDPDRSPTTPPSTTRGLGLSRIDWRELY